MNKWRLSVVLRYCLRHGTTVSVGCLLDTRTVVRSTFTTGHSHRSARLSVKSELEWRNDRMMMSTNVWYGAAMLIVVRAKNCG